MSYLFPLIPPKRFFSASSIGFPSEEFVTVAFAPSIVALVAFETPSLIALPVAFAASIVALVAFETPSLIALPVAFAPSVVALVAFETALVTLFIVAFAESTVAFVALDAALEVVFVIASIVLFAAPIVAFVALETAPVTAFIVEFAAVEAILERELVTSPIVSLVAFTTEFVWLVLNAFDNFSAKDAFGLPIGVLFARISLLFPNTSVNCSTFPIAIGALVALAISPIVAFVALVAFGII